MFEPSDPNLGEMMGPPPLPQRATMIPEIATVEIHSRGHVLSLKLEGTLQQVMKRLLADEELNDTVDGADMIVVRHA